MNFLNIFKHFKIVCRHKFYVGKYCFIAGLYRQGIVHDLSKFSPIEFFESARYFDGKVSPIDVCKKKNGWSKAWMHHKGRNPHHYEYWVDNFDNGGVPLPMPFKYALELCCDYIGAGKAYMRKEFSFDAEYQWWLNKCCHPLAMNIQTKEFIDSVLYLLKETGDVKYLSKEYTLPIYEEIRRKYKEEH